MNILVIGNGFDLAHGLPTAPMDFFRFLELLGRYESSADRRAFVFAEEDLKFKNYLSLLFAKPLEESADVIAAFQRAASENVWVKHFSCSVLSEEAGWVDVEREMSRIIQAFDEVWQAVKDKAVNDLDKITVPHIIASELHEFLPEKRASRFQIQIELSLKEIEETKQFLVNSLDELTSCLEWYLTDFVGNIEVQGFLPDISELTPDKVLCFNYTDTCERLYIPASVVTEYDYLYGKASPDHDPSSCQMILGIDEYLQEPQRSSDVEFIQFKKFYQRIFKHTGSVYREWLTVLNSRSRVSRDEDFLMDAAEDLEENHLYIFGHSLDATDGDVLKELILVPGMKTTVFYHDRKTLGKLIANLVKIIGQDELIARTYGSDPVIAFKEQRPLTDVR